MGREPRSAKASDMPTEEDCKRAQKFNPPGVLAIEYGMKKNNFYRNLGLMAGYLKNCGTTNQLHRIVNSVSDIFKQYDTMRRDVWEGATVPCATLFDFLEECKYDLQLSVLVNEKDIPSKEDIERVCSGIHELVAPLITCNVLVKVINRVPQHFAEVYQYSPAQLKYLPLFEDLHRAYALLRMWYYLNTENKMNDLRWTPRRQCSKNAKVIHYLDTYTAPPNEKIFGLKEELDTYFEPAKQAKEEDSYDQQYQTITGNLGTLDNPINETKVSQGIFHYAGIPILSQKEADMLDPDIDNLLTPLNRSLGLALTIATMLEQERIAWFCRLHLQPTLQARIFTHSKSINRRLAIYDLLYLSFMIGIQDMGKVVKPMKPTLVCIQSAASLGWYEDYIQHFALKLRIFFVGSCFNNPHVPGKSNITVHSFHQAMLEPENSPLFPYPDDQGRTVFIVPHSKLKEYTVEPLYKWGATGKTNSDCGKAMASTTVTTETEDPYLQAEAAKFDAFIVNHSSQFTKKLYRIVVDQAHIARRTSPDVMPVVTILNQDFTWLVAESPQPEEITDLSIYSHVLYNFERELDLSKDFLKANTLQKFEVAESDDELLELFNPLNIRRLAVDGHIKTEDAERTIPFLLQECMIQATCGSEVNRKRKREEDIEDSTAIRTEPGIFLW
ncbi:hypothetical protein MaudCBS49596_002484 [Microsporum audouinii]